MPQVTNGEKILLKFQMTSNEKALGNDLQSYLNSTGGFINGILSKS